MPCQAGDRFVTLKCHSTSIRTGPAQSFLTVTHVWIAWTMLWQLGKMSVCLSITCRYSVETARHILKLLSPQGSHTILVFPYQMVSQILQQRHPPNGGLTEIAGQDNDGQRNLQGLTLQDKKMTDKLAGPDFAGQDNDGQTSRAWHCRTN